MKVSSKIYRGIEYIQLNDLPNDQKERILQNMEADELIKIMIDKKIISDCIQYKYYEQWFDSHFPNAKVHAATETEVVLARPVRMALREA